jgi:RNA-binding protein
MLPATLNPAQRKEFKARAHALHPLVIISEAGLTTGVVKEIERSLNAHELIKIRVVGDDREQRVLLFERICAAVGAAPVQHIGKLLVIYRPKPPAPAAKKIHTGQARAKPASRSGGKSAAPKRGLRSAARKSSSSVPELPGGARLARTVRVRKSGQRSAKKQHQDT